MTLTMLEDFIMLAREKSFTKAARELHITQQSLSAQVAALEEKLGTLLVVRRVPLELTYAGEVLLKYAEDVMDRMKILQREFGDITGNQKGRLRVGIAFTRGRVLMPACIAAFQEQYPNIAVELVETVNEEIERKLLSGDIDLAVAVFEEVKPGLVLQDFYEEEIRLFAARQLLEKSFGEKLSEVLKRAAEGDLRDFARLPFVMSSDADIAGRVARRVLKKQKMTPRVQAKSDNIETLMELCRRGVGACFCPVNLAKAVIPKKVTDEMEVFPLGAEAVYPVKIACRAQSYQWGIIAEFIAVCLKQK